MSQFINKLRKEPHWLALIIFALLCLWLFSGVGGSNADEGESAKSTEQEAEIQKVRLSTMYAEEVDQEVKVYGRTEPDRVATLRAEINGQVMEIYVAEGQPVKVGQKLVRLDKNDLRERLASVQASLKQAEIELKGAKSLGKKGYQSEVAQAQAEASLAAAKAQQAALQLSLKNTLIYAPFDGVMNKHYMEVGDYLREGDSIATVVDLDPLVIKADVTERHVQQLELGQIANGRLVSGQTLAGEVRYISSLSEEGTNTFKVEVAVANPYDPESNHHLRAGMSTELSIPLRKTWAVKITPAVMALDEKGNLGVKTVEQNIVKFVPIDMVKSDDEGVWLAGLGRQADVITLGQGFVRDGDTVEVVMDQNFEDNGGSNAIAAAQGAQ